MGKLIKDPKILVAGYPTVALTADLVIFGFDDNKLKVLLIRSDLEVYEDKWSLLGDVVHDTEEIEDAAYRILKRRTGMTDVYLAEVNSFGSPTRHPGGRVVSIAFCTLLNINHHELKIRDNELHWHNYESLTPEDLAFDHFAILSSCYAWLQKRIQEHPLGLNLLPEKFSLRELQTLYEAILNVELDRRNFRKKLFSMGFLVDTGELETEVKHRPGKLYQFSYPKYEKNRKKWVGIDF